ncbi:MAG: hypothetical protein LRZ88_08680 [Candidatus Cloacimonetes bacterium]|nr:hypothetical protein [Candidatus Cloacimonadota bacterium]
MKPRLLIMLFLLLLAGSILAHTLNTESIGYAWDYRFNRDSASIITGATHRGI